MIQFGLPMSLQEPFTYCLCSIGRDFAFRSHAHGDRWELLVGVSGRVGVRLQGDTVALPCGVALLIPKGAPHGIWDAGAGRTKARYFNATFAGDDLVLSHLVRRGPVALSRETKRFWMHRSEMKCSRGPWGRLWLLGRIQALCAELAQTGAESRVLSKSSPPPVWQFESQLAALIHKEMERMHRRYDLARHFGLSPNALSNRVKRLTGGSVMEHYFRLKVAMAADALGHGGSIRKVAQQLGFANPYHFSRKFKQVMGRSPSGFRP